jgi:hypothetical protein
MSEKEIHMAPAEETGDQSPGEKASSVTSKDDLALKFIHEHGASGPVSEADDRRIRWKIDTRLLPMVSHLGRLLTRPVGGSELSH